MESDTCIMQETNRGDPSDASRDYSIPDLAAWPASFGVVSDDPVNPQTVYARLRVYANGQTRDYLGERYHDNSAMTPEFVANGVKEMCDNALELPVGGIVVGRRGEHAFIPVLSGDDCTTHHFANQTGTFAARVAIEQTGTYEFGVLASYPRNDAPANLGQPPLFPFNEVMLQLRRACDDDATYIHCDPGWGSPTSAADGDPRITQALNAGDVVYLIVGGTDSAASPLEVAVGAWKERSPPPGNDSLPKTPLPLPIALTLENGTTPASEPEPGVTIDRIIRLDVPPAGLTAAHVTMRSACLKTMSKLGDQTIDLANARSCIDANDVWAPITPFELDDDTSASPAMARTFGVATPCPPADPTSAQVCVEGGPFIIGRRDAVGSNPVRTVAVSTFWIDRYETTVADYRASHLPTDNNDGPVELVNGADVGCSWTPSPGKHETFPLVCLSYDRAVQYCEAQSLNGASGELLTQAQWEYAATVAGRPRKTQFSWGDDPPQCACDGSITPCHAPLFGRTLVGSPIGVCSKFPDTLEPVDSRTDPTTGDVTALGIVGMTGSVIEWVQDAGWAYDSQCWYSAPVIDPVCREDNALARMCRGMGWTSVERPLTTVDASAPRGLAAGIGLRCAFASP